MSAHAHRPAAHRVSIEATASIARPRMPQSSRRHSGHSIRVTSAKITLSCDGMEAQAPPRFAGSRILSVYTASRQPASPDGTPCACSRIGSTFRHTRILNNPGSSSARARQCRASTNYVVSLHTNVITMPATGITRTASALKRLTPAARRGRASGTSRTRSHAVTASISTLAHHRSLQILPTRWPKPHHTPFITAPPRRNVSLPTIVERHHSTPHVRMSGCGQRPINCSHSIRRYNHEEEEFRSHRSCDLYLGCDRSDIRERTALPGSARLPERSVHSAGADLHRGASVERDTLLSEG